MTSPTASMNKTESMNGWTHHSQIVLFKETIVIASMNGAKGGHSKVLLMSANHSPLVLLTY